ncbi:MAG: hypothetical protein ACK47B_10745 [Armatimonadota bacterium]
MAKTLRPELGARARAIVQHRGLSVRAAAARCGICRLSLADMLDGVPLRLELIEAFARAFDEDVNEWRELAGYPPILPTADPASEARRDDDPERDELRNAAFVVASEVLRARRKHRRLASAHEGFGVLAEEVAELLDALRSDDAEAISKESVQVAAVALRMATREWLPAQEVTRG